MVIHVEKGKSEHKPETKFNIKDVMMWQSIRMIASRSFPRRLSQRHPGEPICYEEGDCHVNDDLSYYALTVFEMAD